MAFDGVDLEEDVLDHPAAEGAGQLEFVPAEERVVEAPARGGQRAGGPRLPAPRQPCHLHGAHAGVARGPALAGARVGGVAEGTKGGGVEPGLGEGVEGLGLGEVQELGDGGGGGDLDEEGVVEADFVEGVADLEATLDLVGFYEGVQNGAYGGCGGRGAVGVGGAAEVVGHAEDGADVV